MRRIGRYLPLFLFIMLLIVMWRGLSLDPKQLPSVQVGRKLPVLSLSLLEKPGQIVDTAHLQQDSFLLNVWASWCDACRDEQVMLLKLARQNVPIYGLNYKDDRQAALAWLKQWGNPFQGILTDETGQAAIDLGVYGTPETFVIDHGVVRYRYAGILNEQVWQQELKPWLCKAHPQASYCLDKRG